MAIAATLALILGSCARSLSHEEVREQQAAAVELISAIEAYRSDTGQYPEVLGDLAPGYIAVVPAPPLDDAYRYRLVRSDHEFELGFSSGRNSGCSWMSFFDRWDCGFGDE